MSTLRHSVIGDTDVFEVDADPFTTAVNAPKEALIIYRDEDDNTTWYKKTGEGDFDLELVLAANPVSGVETKQQLEDLIAPSEGQRVYVENIDSTFVYKSGQWEQCGEDVILREGLISGSLFVNEITVG